LGVITAWGVGRTFDGPHDIMILTESRTAPQLICLRSWYGQFYLYKINGISQLEHKTRKEISFVSLPWIRIDSALQSATYPGVYSFVVTQQVLHWTPEPDPDPARELRLQVWTFMVSAWIPAIAIPLLSVPLIWRLRGWRREFVRRREGRCSACGYN